MHLMYISLVQGNRDKVDEWSKMTPPSPHTVCRNGPGEGNDESLIGGTEA